MKQYCRYCAFCIHGDAYYCVMFDKLLNERRIKCENHCPEYMGSELGDVDSGKPYRPRELRKRIEYALNLTGKMANERNEK